jgi:6-pyruvoyltetrahydropterin/6-carboxytetrahydropterin synthase
MHKMQCELEEYELPGRSRAALDQDAASPVSAPMHAQSPAWRVVKSYDHAEGLSCCFRQFQAHSSHCRFLHGYALAFRFTFAADTLDDRGWCIDFGGLKPLRAWLHDIFDHTTLIAADDPALPRFQDLAAEGLIQLRVLPAVGCEAFAAHAHGWAQHFTTAQTNGRVREQVDIAEHAGNSASYRPA